MDRDHVLEVRRGELVAKGGRFRRSRAVKKTKPLSFGHHLPDHRHDRRHADASGDEQEILRARRQRKVIHRCRDDEFVAGFDVVDKARRTAFSVRLAFDRNLITVAFGGIVAQRVFAQQTIRHAHGNVRSRRELRQLFARGVAKFEQVDAVGDLVVARDAQRHRRRLRVSRHYFSGKSGVAHNKWRL